MPRDMQRLLRRHIVPVIIIAVGVILSSAAFLATRKWETQKARDAFQFAAEERHSVLEREIEINLEVLSSVQAFHGHGTVDRASFRDFVTPLLRQHKSIQAIEFIPRVPQRERDTWEEKARRDGLAGFRITEQASPGLMKSAAPRKEYFPVYYLEPGKGNEPALGFDLASDPVRKEALEHARDTGKVVATARISPVQAKQALYGILVFAPLYSKGGLDSVAQRRENLTGFGLGVFYPGAILEKSLSYFRPSGIDVYIYDQSASGKDRFLYFHPSRARGTTPTSPAGDAELGQRSEYRYSKLLNVAGRQWTVLYRSTPAFESRTDSRLPALVLAVGLLFTGILANYLLAVNRRAETIGKLVGKRTRELREEIAVRTRTEAELQKAHDLLESRVRERTAELADSEARYRQLFHSNPQPMWVFDLETHAFLDVNEAAVRSYGYSREQFLSMTIRDIRPPQDVPSLLATLERIPGGMHASGVWRHIRKDGSVIFVEVTSHTLDFGGRRAEIVLAHDVTARLRADQEKEALERQLRLSQRMEAIATLAGGIAHDFNNILTAIVGYAMLIKNKLGEDDQCHHQAERILAAAARAATLTQSMLAYSRKQISKPCAVDLGNIVREVVPLLRRVMPESIELSTFLSEEKLTVMADSTQIEQVLMNLATNARDAMPEGGAFQIATDHIELGPEFGKIHGYGEPGSYAVLTVSDTGCGIDERTRERIFEPFFTTKEVGKGTGLGLSTAYGIIKQHNGYINVYSDSGKGTTFTIYLPTTDQPEQRHQPAAVLPLPEKGTETLLLVEDDPEIRAPLKELLEAEGYTVHEAVDGEDGVRRFRELQESVDLVILDVVMPKMNGRAVYEEIRKLRPGARGLFISGYTAEILNARGALPTDVTLVSKPIEIGKLLYKIREVLAQG